jgi:predicted alpha/beta hydrolase
VRLAAVEAGTGTRGVLLIPEVGGVGLCGWLDYASYLDQHGFRTLAFDHRCRQDSECGATSTNELMVDILAGIKRLRADGATSVALVGASQGASEALIAGAGRVDSTVTAVVALSADELTVSLAGAPYAATARQAAAAIQLPVLFAVAQDDSYVSVAETTNMYASAPSDFKRLVTLPTGAGHGWDMVTDLSSALSSTVVAFLTETAK